ncbi:MAG: preprotein translocase subunit SecE [Lachnospirales bacterium]
MEKKNISNEAKQKDGFKEVRGEFRKIVWPTKHDLYKQTLTVVITSLLFGAIIFGYDVFYQFLFSLLH